ncbi:isochorismatase [Frondihabitans sp. PAMC 28766]|uniref:cysteine hydrolase family protein n=1 Tax=Frondihabitans sp. PAMC 28766 TaxID=1795630 RepID=UPI00078E956B|nr:cysteine hydrolase family protein [Frondihabitans sp. PAMC 28766]AMM20338.1 isochorismatase [Frondihabitans sp. PAMC 28766]
MKRALIVIDVQNEYVTGQLKICSPDLSVSMPNILVALDAAQDAGLPTVAVAHVEDASSPLFARGSTGAELHPDLAGRPFAHSIEKSDVSAFVGTDLEEWLRSQDVDTVVITGYMTQHCCAGTARDAAALGFTVEFLSDATGTIDLVNEAGTISAAALHLSVLVTMQSDFAAVATTAEWSLAVQTGETLPVSSIWASSGHGRLTDKHSELHKLMHEARADIDSEVAAGEAHQFAHTLYTGQGITSL